MTTPGNDAARRLAVVTGATGGLGREFIKQLTTAGFKVLATARSRERLVELGKEFGLDDDAYEVHAADLGRAGDSLELAQRLQDRDVELLVNNAGFGSYGPFVDLDIENELRQARVNMLAPMELAHAVLPGMIERQHGTIINISSITGAQPVPRMATYGGTKAFIRSWSHALAEEVRGSGITVTCVSPGPVETGFFDAAGTDEFKTGEVLPAEEVVAKALVAAAKGRTGITPGKVNAVIAALGQIAPEGLAARASGWMVRRKSATPQKSDGQR